MYDVLGADSYLVAKRPSHHLTLSHSGVHDGDPQGGFMV